MTNISLNGSWELYYVKNETFRGAKVNLSSAEAVRASGWDSVGAAVPGNFELDLFRAGVIGDPYWSTNVWQLEKYEYYHLVYIKEFEVVEDFSGFAPALVFEGIDCFAEIWLNGKKLAETDNALIPYEFEPLNLRQGKNELVVHITPAQIAARKYPMAMNTSPMKYNAGQLYVRKAPSQYGWDIMPRTVSAGLWRPVTLEFRAPDRIDDVFMYVNRFDVEKSTADLRVVYNLTLDGDEPDQYRLTVKGVCGTSVFFADTGRLWHNSGNLTFRADGVKFWWPRNYGEPNLYDVTYTLYRGSEPVASLTKKIGVRDVQLERTSTTDEIGSGEFVFRVNGRKIFVLGTNWVPVDAYHSRDRERLEWILPMLEDIGCNGVRCWGGNVYEDDYFYDWCDAHGVMVWQDFAMACAIYPQDKLFQRMLSVEVEKVVKRLRQHVCISLWAGDNECDSSYYWAGGTKKRDPNGNVLTRKIIPEQLAMHDLTRPYLPCSPYIDEYAFQSGRPTSEEHLWGPRDYFKGKFYGTSVCHFASETGYHGCPSPDSLRKFIKPEQLWHWTADRTDPGAPIQEDWLCHSAMMEPEQNGPYSYRDRLMSNQVKTLFGREPQTLTDYAKASQISQAEAKKYFIERFRISKWRRTGIIWWNLIDGWPQISDAIVDWYGTKKLAYSYIKRSQKPVALMFDEPELGGTRLPLYAVNDSREDVRLEYEVIDLTGSGEAVISGEAEVKSDTSARVADYRIPAGEKRFYLIKWKNTATGEEGVNHYMSNIIDIDYDEYLGYMKECGFDSAFEGF